ncbi:MAG: hypothetical protein DMF87_00910 [Acidobacteria bacterium]|nr:MAG: hypothetical protein DMF87_00910 [Acidobacteriota bacterium]
MIRSVAAAILGTLFVGAGFSRPLLVSAQQLPNEPFRQFGTSVTGAFEGWFTAPDGNRYFLVGYLNRNNSQAIDVPIGPNNHVDPGGPDMGQPTHFLPGRHWGMWTFKVPADFTGPDQRLTWTIVANGQPMTIPLRLHPDYVISPFTDVAVKNTPPIMRFAESEPGVQGPLGMMSTAVARTTSAAAPLPLTVWTEDDGKFASGTMALPKNLPPPVRVYWSMYRGPAAVTFDKENPPSDVLAGGGVNVPFKGKATTTAKFRTPGDYVLQVTANDYSGEGGGGEVCCWTTALVKVTVTP